MGLCNLPVCPPCHSGIPRVLGGSEVVLGEKIDPRDSKISRTRTLLVTAQFKYSPILPPQDVHPY